MTTILKPYEVIHYTGISKEFPPCTLRTIHGVEYYEFSNCLGSAFYQTLKDGLADYSDAEPYSNTEAYTIDDVVTYENIYYKAVQDSTGNIPSNVDYWVLAPRFQTECYEKVWCMYLAEYLSWMVIHNRLPFINTQVKGTGLVKLFGNSFKAADDRDFRTTDKAVLRSAEIAFNNLVNYTKKNNDDGCYDNFKPIAETCCSECGECIEDCTCDGCNDSIEDGYSWCIG